MAEDAVVEIRYQALLRPLRLEPNDVLLVQFENEHVPAEIAERVQVGFTAALEQAGHKNRVVVMTGGINVRKIDSKHAVTSRKPRK